MRILCIKADKSNKDAVLKEVELITAEVQTKANGYGYELCHPFWMDGEFRLWIRPLSCNNNRYFPDIDVVDVPFEKPQFNIHTVAYGALDFAEYGKFIDATKCAYELVSYLGSLTQKELTEKFPTIEQLKS